MNSIGPDWQFIAVSLIGLVVTLIGAYAKSISTRVTKLETDQSNLHALVKGDYPTRAEINQSFNRVEQSLGAISSRLDRMIDQHRG